MSKYKVRDKFVIEITQVFWKDADTTYKIKGTNTLYLNDAQLDKLDKLEKMESEE